MRNGTPLIGVTCGLFPQGPDGNAPHASTAMSYVCALEQAGAIPLLVAPVKRSSRLLDSLNGIVLTGGEDIEPAHYLQKRTARLMEPNPIRDEFELALAKVAVKRNLPVLGICRGIQLLNVAMGGTLWQDISERASQGFAHSGFPENTNEEKFHPVIVAADSRLAGALGRSGELVVNSGHHQAVRALGRGLIAVAHAPDGTIEGVESDKYSWVVGVQWHPETLAPDDPTHLALFKALVAAAEKF